MKRFIARVVLEFAAIVAVTITASLLVKTGHPVLGLWILSIYGLCNLWRLSIEKINAQHERGLKEAQMRQLEDNLSIKTAQVHRLEAALVDAASEALWVSDIEIRDSKVVYKIDAPGRGRIVIYLPIEKDAKNEDAPAAPQEG